MKLGVVGAAVLGGAIAGFLDIGAAMLISHVPPGPVLRAIARGLVGRQPMSLGIQLLGLFLQLFMGGLIGAIYGFAALRHRKLTELWIPFGLLYGVAIFLVMNWIVVPLSMVRRLPSFTPMQALPLLAAMLGFGLIVSFAARLGRRA